MITNLVTGGFEPISSYVGEKLGFHNIISNQFKFDDNQCFTGDYHLVNGEKNSKYKFVKQIILDDGSRVEKDFSSEIEDWKRLLDQENDEIENIEYTMFSNVNGVELSENYHF